MNPYDRIAELEEEIRLLRNDWNPPLIFPPEMKLAPKERAVIAVLHRATPKVVSRERFLVLIWPDEYRNDRLVDAMICRVRRKLRPFGVQIRTEGGEGYRLRPDAKDRLDGLLKATR